MKAFKNREAEAAYAAHIEETTRFFKFVIIKQTVRANILRYLQFSRFFISHSLSSHKAFAFKMY
mgnify:FL=1|jgi:hypothetical protein